MITRVVKMTFRPEMVNEFVQLLKINKSRIAGFKGCLHLEIFQTINNPCVFFTYSKWENEENLNEYRNSDLFEKVWGQTKIMFSEKPQAWTLTEVFTD
jgi:quinol monooxygenase YgiN